LIGYVFEAKASSESSMNEHVFEELKSRVMLGLLVASAVMFGGVGSCWLRSPEQVRRGEPSLATEGEVGFGEPDSVANGISEQTLG
jgi:hypothetical protein